MDQSNLIFQIVLCIIPFPMQMPKAYVEVGNPPLFLIYSQKCHILIFNRNHIIKILKFAFVGGGSIDTHLWSCHFLGGEGGSIDTHLGSCHFLGGEGGYLADPGGSTLILGGGSIDTHFASEVQIASANALWVYYNALWVVLLPVTHSCMWPFFCDSTV